MSKGKATRSSTATSSTPAPAPTITNDILTGRFTEHEWNTLVEVEDGEELVSELLGSIVGGVMDMIHQRHLEENIVPFSLNWAEHLMTNLIDWQFLVHDNGESKSDEDNWLQDDEPARAPLDSWGRGSVPTRITEVITEEDVILEPKREPEPIPNQQESSSEEVSESEDFAALITSPDLRKLNKLKEQLKYYKISSDDLVTLSKIEKPSETLHMLFQALGILQGIPASTYKHETAIANINKTREFIESFGPRPISEETLSDMTRFIDDIKLHPDHVAQSASPAARGLTTWLHAAYAYQTLCNILNVETSLDYRVLRCCWIEIKSLLNPPADVKNVMAAVASLLEGKFVTDFSALRAIFASPNLLERMEKFDCKGLKGKFILKFKGMFMKHTTAELRCVNAACSYFYQWCEDQIYGSGSIIVRPPEVKKKLKRRVVKVSPHKVEMEIFDKDSEVSNSGTVDNMLPHQSAAIVKAQQGRPPGQKEVEYDEKGNVVSVMKIRRLPTHRVKTKFEILEHVQQTKKTYPKLLKPLKQSPSARVNISAGLPLETQDHTPLPPSFVDAVTASPGVVIKQGSRVKRGPESVILSPIEHNSPRYQQLLSSN